MLLDLLYFYCKERTAYEMRISDWSSDVCSSDVFDLHEWQHHLPTARLSFEPWPGRSPFSVAGAKHIAGENRTPRIPEAIMTPLLSWSLRYVTCYAGDILAARAELDRSEEQTSELQSLMRISYAVLCLQKNKKRLDHVIRTTYKTN